MDSFVCMVCYAGQMGGNCKVGSSVSLPIVPVPNGLCNISLHGELACWMVPSPPVHWRPSGHGTKGRGSTCRARAEHLFGATFDTEP